MWLLYSSARIINSSLLRKYTLDKLPRYTFSHAKYSLQNDEELFKKSMSENTLRGYQRCLSKIQGKQFHYHIYFLMAELHFSNQQDEEAINCLARSIMANPNNQEAYVKITAALKTMGRDEQAISVLQQGVNNVEEGKGQLLRILAQLYLENRRYREVVQCYRKLVQQIQQQGEHLSFESWLIESTISVPDNELTTMKLKDLYLSKGNVNDGIALLQQISRIRDTESINTALLSLYLQSGRLSQAKSILEHLLKLNSQNYDSTLSLATIYLQQNMPQEAIPLFEKASQLNKTDSMPVTSLGLIYLQTHRKAEAYSAFELALEKNQNDAIALSSLGSMQISQNQLKEGIMNIKKALEIDPSNETAKASLKMVSSIMNLPSKE